MSYKLKFKVIILAIWVENKKYLITYTNKYCDVANQTSAAKIY